MDDQLYNQIFLKPRFQLDYEMNAKAILTKIKDNFSELSSYKIKIVDSHVVLDISDKDAHFWSPQLHLEIEQVNESLSKIKGLFGPKPQVWTFFIFLHFLVATAFLIFAILAYSNWSLNKVAILPIVMLIVLPIIWVTLYFIGSIGKATGKDQMDALKLFTKQMLKEIKSN
ncbi:MAG: GTP-binding protein [Tenacibaculum sp.]